MSAASGAASHGDDDDGEEQQQQQQQQQQEEEEKQRVAGYTGDHEYFSMTSALRSSHCIRKAVTLGAGLGVLGYAYGWRHKSRLPVTFAVSTFTIVSLLAFVSCRRIAKRDTRELRAFQFKANLQKTPGILKGGPGTEFDDHKAWRHETDTKDDSDGKH
jgi:hypothetical protein